jgi:hypothetical protein
VRVTKPPPDRDFDVIAIDFHLRLEVLGTPLPLACIKTAQAFHPQQLMEFLPLIRRACSHRRIDTP